MHLTRDPDNSIFDGVILDYINTESDWIEGYLSLLKWNTDVGIYVNCCSNDTTSCVSCGE